MGTTLTNIYFFPTPEKKELVSRLQKHFKAEGYKAVKGEDGYDIMLRVCSSKEKPCFVSVEAMDGSGIESFTVALSESLACDVLVASVYDSDFLELYYQDHQARQCSVLEIGYPLEEDGFIRRGDISLLAHLAADEGGPERLSDIWNGDYISEDERLSYMLALFGCDDELYKQETKTRNLMFSRQDSTERGFEIIREGSPRLTHYTKPYYVENHDYLNCVSCYNQGGPSKGISVLISGGFAEVLLKEPAAYDTIEAAGYIDPTPLSSNENEPEYFSSSSYLYPKESDDGSKVLVADFPDVIIPNGIIINEKVFHSRGPTYGIFWHYYFITFRFKFNVALRPTLLKTPLTFHIVPHANREEGAVSNEMLFVFEKRSFRM